MTKVSIIFEPTSGEMREIVGGTYPNTGHFNTNVEHLTLGFRIRVVSAQYFVVASEQCFWHVLQTVRRPWFSYNQIFLSQNYFD